LSRSQQRKLLTRALGESRKIAMLGARAWPG